MSELESTESSPESPVSPETLELVEKLNLPVQYEEQVKMLRGAGILEFLPQKQDMGLIGIDGKEYPIPKYDQILASLDSNSERRELLERKHEQGFEKLLLVPIGMTLEVLIDRYKQQLLEHHQEKKEKKLLDTEGNPIDLNPDDPIYIDSPYQKADYQEKLIYYPQRFSEDNHQGKTKQELIDDGRAWEVILVEDLPNLPAEGKGETKGGRRQLEANQSSNDYLKKFQTDPQYKGETGLTLEANLIYALTQLREKNQVIDNYQAKGKVCRLTGAMFLSGAGVPVSFFDRDHRRAFLSWNLADSRYSHYSVRAGVPILNQGWI